MEQQELKNNKKSPRKQNKSAKKWKQKENETEKSEDIKGPISKQQQLQ